MEKSITVQDSVHTWTIFNEIFLTYGANLPPHLHLRPARKVETESIVIVLFFFLG